MRSRKKKIKFLWEGQFMGKSLNQRATTQNHDFTILNPYNKCIRSDMYLQNYVHKIYVIIDS